MIARTSAVPPTLGSKNLAEPQIDETAYVHSFSNLVGDVKVGAKVLIAAGTSIRADEGTPFYIGDETNIQDGVIIHGLEKGKVVGDDGKEYSVWIGRQSNITHMALIHGPAYIGDDCFIGFRSTVFNARIGKGCVVMMHALIQNVEIPPGKFVPSGMIVTNQELADQLPDVQDQDRAYSQHVVEITGAVNSGYQQKSNGTEIMPIRDSTSRSISGNVNETNYENSVEIMSVNTEIRNQIRALLSQGYTIGGEHADQRRFKTKSWSSCGTVDSHREDQILTAIAGWLQEYEGEYVRLLGVDTNAKRRVLEVIIQRPGDVPGTPSRTTTTTSNFVTNGHSSNNLKGLKVDAVSQVRALLHQGCKIGVEHADARRFKTSSWLTGFSLDGVRESDAIRKIEAFLAEHPAEYVRLIGIDPVAKRRISETVIQRPSETATSTRTANGSAATKSSYSNVSSGGNTSVSSDLIAKIRALLSQGHKIGTEHADKRRFKINSWETCSPIDSTRENDVIAALEACLQEHQGEYVRLLGIDPKAKRRVLETVIQRPDGNATNGSSATATLTATPNNGNSNYASVANPKNLDAEVVTQVRSLLSQGHKISTEHTDKRRFRSKSWESCAPITATREADVLRALESCLADHQGKYVRLLGIDTNAKRRVLETIIQRP